jgi:hypothetical protein
MRFTPDGRCILYEVEQVSDRQPNRLLLKTKMKKKTKKLLVLNFEIILTHCWISFVNFDAFSFHLPSFVLP